LSFVILSFSVSGHAAPSLQVRAGASNSIQISGIELRTTPATILNPRLIQVPNSAVFLVTWQEQTNGSAVSYYAISPDGRRMGPATATTYVLALRSGKIDLTSRQKLAVASPPSEVQIVQFWTPLMSSMDQQLKSIGVTFYRYLPNHAYIVSMAPEVRERVAALPYVRTVAPVLAVDKLNEGLITQLLRNEAGAIAGEYNVEAFERGSVNQTRIGEFVKSLGGKVLSITPEGCRMQITLEPRNLPALANLAQVAFIDPASAPENDYDLARQIGGQDYVENIAGFSGQGVRAEVFDDGLRITHIGFQAIPVLIHGSQPGIASGHGTSTYGINFGDGTGEPRARGGVPSAQGIFATYLTLTNRYVHTAELLQDPFFAVYQSNSWGNNPTTQYTTISREMDDIIFINDILICQSQSNNGNQLSRPQAWAKNIVSVGGVYHFGSLDMSTHRWNHGGSIGPAEDGRIKPDLAHFYDRVYSTSASSDSSYTSGFGGTSAATPITATHFGIFYQMWHNGIFGNPTGPTVFDSRPHMATAKAILINTAKQWPFSGETSDLTRTHQGWGLPDLQNLYDMRNNILIVDQTDVLQTGESTAYYANAVPDLPVKATLVYMDLPGTTSSTQHRINDLSLRATSPSGVVYWGNNGLLASNWSDPGGEEDHINTVENVFVEFPEAGTWLFEVLGTEINQDEHPGTPEIDSDYALVISGVDFR
jgi:hypothetical protein